MPKLYFSGTYGIHSGWSHGTKLPLFLKAMFKLSRTVTARWVAERAYVDHWQENGQLVMHSDQ